MIHPSPFTTAQGPASGSYQQVLYWTVKDKPRPALLISVLSIPVFLLLGYAFWLIAVHIGKFPDNPQFILLQPVIFIVGIPITILLHEIVHGLTMRGFGARPRYGMLLKQLLFYATAPGYGFRRNAYLLVILAPLVGLSCLAVLGMVLLRGTTWVALFAVWAAFNAGGALGDMWFVSLALRYPKTAFVVDERDGIRVFMRRE